MTALTTNDALAESQHVAAMLRRHAATLPPGATQVNQLLLACQLFERCQQQSDAAVAAWRTALARRWECEIAGRRIYKQVERQYLEWYGPASLELQRIISHDDGNFSPADLLADLRRIQADLALLAGRNDLAQNHDHVAAAAERLEATIHNAAVCEAARRGAVLERRIAQDAFRRARTTAQHGLAEHGSALPGELRAMLT